MYIWIGCRLPEDFSHRIRTRCLELKGSAGLDTSGFSLPQHISLKISFDAGEKHEEIVSFLENLLSRERPFHVRPMPAAQQGNILWIPFEENTRLRHLHDRLDRELNHRFDIPQHQFDKAFLFHSTLFLGDLPELQQMAADLSDEPLPPELFIDTFLLGLSETGKSGSYRVIRQIKV